MDTFYAMLIPEAYTEPTQTSKNENFGFEPLTSFEKHPILDV